MCFRLEFIVGFAVISCHLTKTALGKSHKNQSTLFLQLLGYKESISGLA